MWAELEWQHNSLPTRVAEEPDDSQTYMEIQTYSEHSRGKIGAEVAICTGWVDPGKKRCSYCPGLEANSSSQIMWTVISVCIPPVCEVGGTAEEKLQ